jgi:hypothetical protein
VNRASLADVGGSWVDMVANVSELATEYIAHRANDFEIRERGSQNRRTTFMSHSESFLTL